MANDATELVTVMNKGVRTYHTSHGALEPNGVLKVPKSEAAVLTRYSDIVNASKLVEAAEEPKPHRQEEEVAEPDEKPEIRKKQKGR